MVICSKTKLRFIFKEAKWQPVWPGGRLRAPSASSTDVGQVHVTWGASTRTGVPLGEKSKFERMHFYPISCFFLCCCCCCRKSSCGWLVLHQGTEKVFTEKVYIINNILLKDLVLDFYCLFPNPLSSLSVERQQTCLPYHTSYHKIPGETNS